MLNDSELAELEDVARRCRRDIVRMTHKAGSGHPGGSLSAIDALVVLYLRHMRVRPEDPLWHERDMFFLSKGHCTPAYYAAMAARGYVPHEELLTFRAMGSRLQGHPSNTHLPGVDSSSGSLGQGLSLANGAALAARYEGLGARYYVMIGDGESQEGQIWEAAMTSAARGLDNVCAIVDVNGIQLDGPVESVKSLGDLPAKWRAFGWNVIDIDGHDLRAVDDALTEAARTKGVPTTIISRTVKGKGVSFIGEHRQVTTGSPHGRGAHHRSGGTADDPASKSPGAATSRGCWTSAPSTTTSSCSTATAPRPTTPTASARGSRTGSSTSASPSATSSAPRPAWPRWGGCPSPTRTATS